MLQITPWEDVDIVEDAIRQRAIQDLGEFQAESAIAAMAIIAKRMLEITAVVDHRNTLVRGKILNQIERQGWYTIHPGGFGSLDELALDCGISKTQVSQALSYFRIVYPFLRQKMQMTDEDIQSHSVGNVKEIIPHLRAIITREPSQSESTNEYVKNTINDIRTIDPDLNEEEITLVAVDALLNQAKNLTRSEMRKILNPDRTPNITTYLFGNNGRRIAILDMNEDQMTMLIRIMAKHIEVTPIPEIPTRLLEMLK